MDTGLITIERTAMIPTRISRQITPMLFSGTDKAERTVLGIFHGQHQKPEHAPGVPDGRLPVCRLVRGQGPAARARRADDRRGLC